MNEQNKQGWVSMSEAAEIAGISRPSVYYYLNTRADDIRTRPHPSKMQRQIKIEDLLAVLREGNEDAE